MKKRLSKINICVICLLVIFFVLSSLGCIKESSALPAGDIYEPIVEYKALSSVSLIIAVVLQVVLCFFDRKLFRGISVAISALASLLCIGKMIAISLSDSIIGGPIISLTPIGYLAIINSIVIVILTVVSLFQLSKASKKTG